MSLTAARRSDDAVHHLSSSWGAPVNNADVQQSSATDFIAGHTDRIVVLGDPVVDRLVTTVLELGAELWLQRRRLLALERALVGQGLPVTVAIEQALPSEAERAAERELRDAMIARLYGPLLAALDGGSAAP